MSDLEYPPNTEMARAFLEKLGPGEEFTFQLFGDREKDGKLACKFHGSLTDDLARRLATLNNEGRGVFVAINETDLQGRRMENIVRVRSLFVDLDGAPLEPVQNAPLPPDIIVETSPGRYHCYWLVRDVRLDEFSALQRALAVRFDGDPAVHDLPRCGRLPGFWHLKGEPFLTRIIHL